jgi:hypothetical protein
MAVHPDTTVTCIVGVLSYSNHNNIYHPILNGWPWIEKKKEEALILADLAVSVPHEVGAVSEQDLDRLHSLEHEIDRRLFISNNGQNSWQSDRRRRFLPRLVRKRLKNTVVWSSPSLESVYVEYPIERSPADDWLQMQRWTTRRSCRNKRHEKLDSTFFLVPLWIAA